MFEKILNYIENYNQENIEQKYQDYLNKEHIYVMTGAGIVQLLNKCVSMIDKDRCYLEVGTHRGSTLIGASLDYDVPCYGVDNFVGHNTGIAIAPYKSVEEGLQAAIENVAGNNVKYFKSSYQDFFKDRKDVDGKKGRNLYV